MEEKHYIEWIEVIVARNIYRKFLKSGDKLESEFKIRVEKVAARKYHNIHGLWSYSRR